MNESVIKKYEGRIKKGIALLDKKLGRKKWTKKIDVSELDLSSPLVCILGETFGRYGKGLTKLNIDYGQEYGFDTYDSDEYGLLTRLWIGALYKLGIKG